MYGCDVLGSSSMWIAYRIFVYSFHHRLNGSFVSVRNVELQINMFNSMDLLFSKIKLNQVFNKLYVVVYVIVLVRFSSFYSSIHFIIIYRSHLFVSKVEFQINML